MSRLQVGGLALVIDDIVNSENIGKVVKLIKFHEEVPIIDANGKGTERNTFEVACDSGIILWSGEVLYNGGVCYKPKYLMPLGDKQTQDELMKQLEEV